MEYESLVMVTVCAAGAGAFIGNRVIGVARRRWQDYRTAAAVAKARGKYTQWPPPPAEVFPGAQGGGTPGVGAAQELEIGELWGKATGATGYPDTLADSAVVYFKELYGWDVHRVKQLEPDMFYVMRHELKKWIETGVEPHTGTGYRFARAFVDKITSPAPAPAPAPMTDDARETLERDQRRRVRESQQSLRETGKLTGKELCARCFKVVPFGRALYADVTGMQGLGAVCAACHDKCANAEPVRTT